MLNPSLQTCGYRERESDDRKLKISLEEDPVRVFKSPLVKVVVSAVVTAGVIGGAQAALADQGSNAPSPAVSEDGHVFYSDTQIDAAWASAVSSFPFALPSDATFPKDAPAFFKPGDGQKHLWETGLPTMIAASYYRCAWLKDSLSASTAGRVADIARADLYFKVPAVQANLLDLQDYVSNFAAAAHQQSIDPVRYEIEANCGGLTND